VISYGGKIHRIDVDDGDTHNIPFTALVEQHVTRALRFKQNLSPDYLRIRMVSWPNQSASGNELVFSALGSLFRMKLPQGDPTPIETEGPRAYAPSYAPDRNRIAYVTWSDTDGGQVWIMDTSGRGSRRITNVPGQYSNPVFSPDGTRLAFLMGSGATGRGRDLGDELWFDIMWVPASGGAPHYVVSIDNRGPSRKMPRLAWSPNGTRIFYNEDQGSGKESRTVLLSIRPDGTDKQEHLKIRHAEEIVPSPSGRWVIYSRLHQGYLAALPALGRDPVELPDDKGPLPAYRFSKEGADWLNWSSDGRTLTWGFGPSFYRVALEDVQAAWDAKKTKDAAKTVPGFKEEKDKDKKKDDPAAVHPDTVQVQLYVPRHRPEGTYALTGARLITMKGDEIVPRGTIIVKNDRIVAVGPEGQVTVPPEARIFLMSGKTIIPGLIDVHAHMHYSYLDIIPETVDSYYANLAYGVTTSHDPSASTYAVFTQAEMVEAGVTSGPRIFSTAFILYSPHIPNTTPIETLADARHHVKRLKTLGAISVKSYMQPRRNQRQWVIEAAREESIMVVPEGGGNLEMDMTMVLDGHTGIEHALPVAPLYNDVVTLMARSGTGYTPTLLVAYGGLSGEHWFYQHHEVWQDEKLLRFFPRGQIDARARRRSIMATDDDWHHMDVAAGCKEIVEAGGMVQLGAHGQLQGLGAHWELWALVQGGMSNHDALRSATITGAEYIGLDRWVGSIEPGKLADFVILDGDPLQDIQNSNTVHAVVKNGEMWNGDTMNRIWPTEAPRPPFAWEVQGAMLGAPDSPGRR
jgi:imidazolonepropionase-like amidohydrolase